MCGPRQRRITRICYERDLRWSGIFNPFDACHFQLCVAA